MATNSSPGRKGAIRKRSQVLNPVTQTWTKRDEATGRFLGSKGDGTPFKGVRQEKKSDG